MTKRAGATFGSTRWRLWVDGGNCPPPPPPPFGVSQLVGGSTELVAAGGIAEEAAEAPAAEAPAVDAREAIEFAEELS